MSQRHGAVANLGGNYTFAIERPAAMTERSAVEDSLRATAMRNVGVDSASLGPAVIHCAAPFSGRSTVVLATDMRMLNASLATARWKQDAL